MCKIIIKTNLKANKANKANKNGLETWAGTFPQNMVLIALTLSEKMGFMEDDRSKGTDICVMTV